MEQNRENPSAMDAAYGDARVSVPAFNSGCQCVNAHDELLEAAQAAMQCIGELSPTQARVEVAQLLTAAIARATESAA